MKNVVVTRPIHVRQSKDLFSIDRNYDILSKVIRKLCLPILLTRYGIHRLIFVIRHRNAKMGKLDVF